MDSELEVLRLLACWAEGHTLVPPLVPQVTAGDPENLAVLLELDVRVPRKDGPARMVRRTVLVRLRGRGGPAARRRARPWGRGRQRGAQSPRGAVSPSAHRRANGYTKCDGPSGDVIQPFRGMEC